MQQSAFQPFFAAKSLVAAMTPLCCLPRTHTQLQLLHNSHVIYVDSTFRVVPALYYQLFTIFVPHDDFSFPVKSSSALMTRKTTALYRAVLERLHQLASLFAPIRSLSQTSCCFRRPATDLWLLVPLRAGRH